MDNNARYEKWLDHYLTPQMINNPEIIKEIFAEDCRYCYGPYFASRNGLQETYEHHKNALSHQKNIKYIWKLLAATEKYGIAWFDLTLDDESPGEPNAYQGIFKITLNDDDKCALFEEWYNMTTFKPKKQAI